MVLTRRELNRALLARQGLLSRTGATPVAMVEHLVGLQAQAPLPPYYGLWSRLEGFDPHELGRLLTDRAGRAADAHAGDRPPRHAARRGAAAPARPARDRAQPQRRLRAAHGRRRHRRAGARRARAAGRRAAHRARGRARLVERGIGDDVEAIANAVRAYAPLVQVPPRGVWGAGGQARYATLEAFTGLELEADPSIDDVVLRYLGAFGPASVMDMQNWSGLTRLKAVFERLRPRLATFAGEDGRELFDLPDAPRPDPATPGARPAARRVRQRAARPRRPAPDHPRRASRGAPMLAPGRFVNNLLVDGMLRATWWLERDGRRSDARDPPGRRVLRGRARGGRRRGARAWSTSRRPTPPCATCASSPPWNRLPRASRQEIVRDIRLIVGAVGLSAVGDGLLWVLLAFHIGATPTPRSPSRRSSSASGARSWCSAAWPAGSSTRTRTAGC